MSGICGIMRSNKKPIDEHEITHFTDAIIHKGDDETGVWYKNHVAFGHKMLWTTPESLHEKQPLYSRDKTIVLTADARIDNREDIIKRLNIKQYDGDIITDADLIIKSYQKWGFSTPNYLIGDFSFALWDEKQQLLFCARDRIGIKPFFYTETNKSLYFSSEISAIFKTVALKKKLNITAFEDYLLSLSIDFESTFFENIYRLPPASYMIVKNGKKRIQRYWTPDDLPDFNTRSAKQNSEEFFDLLRQATQAQLRSNYAVGVSLSGGLDSSAISYFASELRSDNPIKAYSILFGNLSCDESTYINEVLKFTHLDASFIQGDKLDYADKYSIKNFYTFMSDAPAFGFYLPLTSFMELLKKEKVRVLLTGNGGDHTTQGSPYYIEDWFREGKLVPAITTIMQLDHPWGFLKQSIRPVMPKIIFDIKKKYFNKQNIPILKSGRTEVSFKDIEQLYPVKNASRRFDVHAIMGSMTSILNDTGVYVDAGYYNFEVRDPFFDHRVVDFSFQVPASQKFTPAQQKSFFANYSQKYLPELVRKRNNKASYTEMLEMQYRQNSSVSNVDFPYIRQTGLLNPKYFSDKIPQCEICEKWQLLTLEKWLEHIYENR